MLKEKQVGPFKLEVDDNPEVVTNPFSGQSIELEPDAVALHDFIRGAEMFGDYEEMQNALQYFAMRWPKEYMVLLD